MRNNLYEQIRLLKWIKSLMMRKATGTPEELFRRIKCSRSALFRNIDVLRKLEYPVKYCRDRETYYFDTDGEVPPLL